MFCHDTVAVVLCVCLCACESACVYVFMACKSNMKACVASSHSFNQLFTDRKRLNDTSLTSALCVCVPRRNTGVSVMTWTAVDHVTVTWEEPSTTSESLAGEAALALPCRFTRTVGVNMSRSA